MTIDKTGILVMGALGGYALALGDHLVATFSLAFAITFFYSKLFYGTER